MTTKRIAQRKDGAQVDWDPFALRIKTLFDALYGDRRGEGGGGSRGFGWKDYFPEGRARHAYDAEAVRCCAATYERAVRIVNAICLEARKAGYSIGMGHSCTCVDLSRDGIRTSFRLVERGRRVETELPSHKDHFLPGVHRVIGTGCLELRVEEGRPLSVTFKDRADIDLVDQAPSILSAIQRIHETYLAAENERINKLEGLARARAQREEAQRRLDEERALEKRRIEEKQARRDQLIRDASKWDAAQQILRYVDAMEQKTIVENGDVDGFDRWKSWALGVAQELIDDSAAAVRTGSQ